MTAKELETKINAKLAKDNFKLGPGVAAELLAEGKTDNIVNGMLQSLGQDLTKNLKAKSEKHKQLVDSDTALKHLRLCEAQVNEEVI